jgi:hypothetical protein
MRTDFNDRPIKRWNPIPEGWHIGRKSVSPWILRVPSGTKYFYYRQLQKMAAIYRCQPFRPLKSLFNIITGLPVPISRGHPVLTDVAHSGL